jgi:hypothetical protein
LRLRTTSNEDHVFAAMDRFAVNVQRVAAPRALNTLRDQAETAGFREIADVYQVGPRTMEQYASITVATPEQPQASIKVKGRGFPLQVFKPVQTSKGVSVLLKGRRQLFEHAFMVKRFGTHVFARGAYGGKAGGFKPTGEAQGRFQFGVTRNPIRELFSFGPVEAFSNKDVTQAMQDRVDDQMHAVFSREIQAVRRGF